MRYDAIVFDVSDTLVDYTPDFGKLYGDRVRALGLPVSEDEARAIRRAVNWAIGQVSLKRYENPCAPPEDERARKDEAALSCVSYPADQKAAYLKRMAQIPKARQEMRVIPGVIETLEILKTRYRLAIVSNHHIWLRDRLHELQLAPYFESIIISEAVGIEKPDPRILDIALREMNLPAARCLYVGDHPLDVLCAKKAGMDCAWILGDWDTSHVPEAHRADYAIQSVSDLIDIV